MLNGREMSRLERLERIEDILQRQTDQMQVQWDTCLWNAMCRDRDLLEAGFRPPWWPQPGRLPDHRVPGKAVSEFLGCSLRTGNFLVGSTAIKRKIGAVRRLKARAAA
jgi:hypothetical protein